MKINPKITEEAVKTGIDLISKTKELTSKAEVGNVLRTESPKGIVGQYFHPDLLKDKSFDVEKAIEEFHDINDTETISKICTYWREEYSKLLEDFSPEKVAKMEDPKATHQSAINRINKKYEKFTNKIAEIHDSKKSEEKVLEVFNTYIEPITQLSMKTYSKIDRISAMSNAYQKDGMIKDIKVKLSKCKIIEDLQEIIFEVEKLKEISPKDYERYNKIIEKQIEEFLTKTAENNGAETKKEITTKIIDKDSPKKKLKTEVNNLEKEIEGMSPEEILEGTKVGEIYNALDEMRRHGNDAYIRLRDIFDKKLMDISKMVA